MFFSALLPRAGLGARGPSVTGGAPDTTAPGRRRCRGRYAVTSRVPPWAGECVGGGATPLRLVSRRAPADAVIVAPLHPRATRDDGAGPHFALGAWFRTRSRLPTPLLGRPCRDGCPVPHIRTFSPFAPGAHPRCGGRRGGTNPSDLRGFTTGWVYTPFRPPEPGLRRQSARLGRLQGGPPPNVNISQSPGAYAAAARGPRS